MATILVADDSPVSRRLISYTLQRNGHTVITVSDGQEALAQLMETTFDLVIADLSMPNVDGLTLLRALRNDERRCDLPLIMLTASGQDEDRLKAQATGANDFLTKPTSSRQLTETVSRLLA